MEVKNFSQFGLYQKDNLLDCGHMDEMMSKAQAYAEKEPGCSFDICFIVPDGDIDDENTKMVRGTMILSYHQLFEGKLAIMSGE